MTIHMHDLDRDDLWPIPSEIMRVENRTFIVSGLARSGTSMVAQVLQGAGVFMGDELDDVVFEDHEFSLLFSETNYSQNRLQTLARGRDQRHAIWGFKRPHLHVEGSHLIELFRNPFVILMVRDPVAIASRNAIAEQVDASISLADATGDLYHLLRYADSLCCPVLLMSYEIAVMQPDLFLDRLLKFCGLDVPNQTRGQLLKFIEPDRPQYIEAARRVFEGYIDHVDGTELCGWARQRDLHLPVRVTLFQDDVAVQTVRAENHRPDLAQLSIGIGNHGFSFDLSGLNFSATSRVTVKIEGRIFALQNSGLTLAELGG